MQAFALPFRNRTTLLAILRLSIRERAAGSALGFLFVIAYPLLFLLVYSFVFIFILKIRVPNWTPETYTIAIFCGLVPFLAFADALSVGTSSIVSNATLVRNLIFPYQLVPLKDTVVSHYAMSFGMLALVAAAIWDKGFSPTLLVVPFIYLVQIIFAVGLVWIFATCNVFFRDLSKMMPIIVLFLMMISPIAYTKSMIPPEFHLWISLNPISHFIFIYRDLLLAHVVDWTEIAQVTLVAVVCYLVGFFVTTRLRPLVFDYV